MTSNNSTIKVKVDDQTSKGIKSAKAGLQNFTSAVGAVQGPLNGITGRMSAFNTVLGRAGLIVAGTGIAIAGLAKVMYESFQAGLEVEKNQLKLAQLIETTGFAAGFSANQINEMAENLDRTTLASANGAREAAAALVTFKNISGPIFEQTLVLAQDMSAVFGTDLRASAVQLGKALEDPTIGLTALNRVGISFSETEKQLIKDMQASGDTIGAQTSIIEKLKGQIGGAAVGQAGGAAGAVDGMAFAWTQLMEELGKITAGQTAIDVIQGITSAISFMRDAMTEETDKPIDVQIQNQIALIQELNSEQESLKNTWLPFADERRRSNEREISQAEMQLRILAVMKSVENERIELIRTKSAETKKAMELSAQTGEISKAELDRIVETNSMLNDEAKAKNDREEELFQLKLGRILEIHRQETNVALIRKKEEKDAATLQRLNEKAQLKSRRSLTTNLVGLLNYYGNENKNAARAAIVIEKVAAIAGIIAQDGKAREAALAWSQTMGPAGDAYLSAQNTKITAITTGNIAAVSALGGLQLRSLNTGGGGGGPSGVSDDPSVDDHDIGPGTLIQRNQVQQPQNITIELNISDEVSAQIVRVGVPLAIGDDGIVLGIDDENDEVRTIRVIT